MLYRPNPFPLTIKNEKMKTKKKLERVLHFYTESEDGKSFIRSIDFYSDAVEAIQALAECRKNPNIFGSELINAEQMHDIFEAGYNALLNAKRQTAKP
jgi:hypothetical protein